MGGAGATGVAEFRQFLRERLEPGLVYLKDLEDILEGSLEDLERAKMRIADLKGGRRSETVDVGCGYLVEATLRDPEHIAIAIGYGFYVECPVDEAPDIIVGRAWFLKKKLDRVRQRISVVETHVGEMKKAIGQLEAESK